MPPSGRGAINAGDIDEVIEGLTAIVAKAPQRPYLGLLDEFGGRDCGGWALAPLRRIILALPV